METRTLPSSQKLTDYDDIAQRYDILEKSDVTLWHIGYQNLLSHLEPIVNKTILDYGCGSGTFCRFKTGGSIVIMNSNWDRSNGKEFISFKMENCANLSSGKEVTAVIKTEPPIYLNDYYWSREDYCTYLTKTGFKNCTIHEPLAIGDEFPWINEKSYPPYYIIKAKK